MRVLPHPATENLQLTEVLRALSDPVRLDIVTRLAGGEEMPCMAMASDIDVHKSTLSHHYKTLREAGVTHTTVDGRQRFIRLRRADLDARFPGLLDSVLLAAAAVT